MDLPEPCIMVHKLEDWRVTKSRNLEMKAGCFGAEEESQVGFKHPLESEDFHRDADGQASSCLQKSSKASAAQQLSGSIGEVFWGCFSSFISP